MLVRGLRVKPKSGMPLAFALRVRASRHLVWHLPPEVNLSGDEFTAAHGVDFAVAKTLARRCICFVHNEGAISLLELVNLFEMRHRRAVRPADLEIGRAIERIVDRTREVKVVVEQRLNGGAIFVDISLQAGSSDCERGIIHCQISFHRVLCCGMSGSCLSSPSLNITICRMASYRFLSTS